jgi:hypothetical protein
VRFRAHGAVLGLISVEGVMIRRIMLLTGPSPVDELKVIEIRRAPVLARCQAQNSEGKGHTFESCRVRQLFFVLQRDMQTQPETSVLVHSRE